MNRCCKIAMNEINLHGLLVEFLQKNYTQQKGLEPGQILCAFQHIEKYDFNLMA